MTTINPEFETFDFPTTYVLRVLPQIADDRTPHNFRRQPKGSSPGDLAWEPDPRGRSIFVEVSPATGPTWVGRFAPGLEGVSCVFATPCPDKFCVVVSGEGYWVSSVEPAAYELIPCIPVKAVHAVREKGLIVFASYTDLTAYGAKGLIWTTPRLSWDGLRIIEITQQHIRGQAWDSPSGHDVEFVVDLSTGRHQGGSSPEMYVAQRQ